SALRRADARPLLASLREGRDPDRDGSPRDIPDLACRCAPAAEPLARRHDVLLPLREDLLGEGPTRNAAAREPLPLRRRPDPARRRPLELRLAREAAVPSALRSGAIVRLLCALPFLARNAGDVFLRAIAGDGRVPGDRGGDGLWTLRPRHGLAPQPLLHG